MHNESFIEKKCACYFISIKKKRNVKDREKEKKGEREEHNLSLSFSSKQSKNILVFYRFIG
jgi:hypothetical protein